MVSMKTRFLDIDTAGKPHAVVKQEALDAEDMKIQSELASLYHEQWVDGEMWKEFEINTDESKIYQDKFYEEQQI